MDSRNRTIKKHPDLRVPKNSKPRFSKINPKKFQTDRIPPQDELKKINKKKKEKRKSKYREIQGFEVIEGMTLRI